MNATIDATRGTTVLMVRTAGGIVARGGPTTKTLRVGAWEVIVDDFGSDSATHDRLVRIGLDAAADPIDATHRHFARDSSELFALIGPPGVVAGAGPDVPGRGRIAVLVEPRDGVFALGLADDGIARTGWLALPAGSAVCWGPDGPEVFCDFRPDSDGLWVSDDKSGRWSSAA